MTEWAKSPEDYFRDWEDTAFGFGYGSGERHILPHLKRFLELCRPQYDHNELEQELGPEIAWLLINALAHSDVIEYGTSPRYGWLTPHGKLLQQFVLSKTADELVKLATHKPKDYVACYPNACNCGPGNYEKGRVCDNPFWPKNRGLCQPPLSARHR